MSQTRQLAAIMFTDIVGYTALMGEDERRAFELLQQNRQLQKPLIEQYGGRWIKELGDGVLASFPTASDAVACATEIQNATATVEGLRLRIGIHLGEVVVENEDVFGDGVNIASRIQAIAAVGRTWISDAVQKNIANKKDIQTKFIREETLKHVKEPIRLYEIISENKVQEGSSNKKSAKNPSFQKSIAVLPFVNMSNDPEQEFFSDGLTEEIITGLSKLEKLLVISRNSMMTFKGLRKKTTEIAKEVNAHYVLEGSVRKAGNNLRITAQLVDAFNDNQLWAEKYTGTVDDVFDIQEKVSCSIVEALEVKLTREEVERLSDRPIQNAKAFEYYILARQEIWKRTEVGLSNGITYAERGLQLTGDNASLYAVLAMAYCYFYQFSIRLDPSNVEKAYHFTSKSLMLDPDCALAYLVLGEIEFQKGNLQQAANLFKKVLHLDPNNADALIWLSVSYFISGRTEAARPLNDKLMLVDPLNSGTYGCIADIELFSGNLKESVPLHRIWLQLAPESPFVRFMCSWAFAAANELDECTKVLDAMITETPTLLFGMFARFFKSAIQGDKVSALRYATDELKQGAASIIYFPFTMAYGFVLIDEKDEAVWWLNKSLDFGYAPYPLLLKFEVLHQVLKDNPGFHAYMKEIKKRSKQFTV